MEYSVVVITKNEEKNILNCINSIINGIPKGKKYEIILVDSASEDKTIEIVKSSFKNYNVKVFSITEATHYSAALGRHIGTKEAIGEYILYLDGDMELNNKFLENIQNELLMEDIVGIIGKRNDYFYNVNGEHLKIIEDVYKIGSTKKVAQHFGGAIIFKRSLINYIGGFDKNIIASEEPELYIRLLKGLKDKKVIQVPHVMINHHINNIERIIPRITNGRSKGLGQTFRKNIGSISGLKILFKHKPISDFFVPYILINFLILGLLAVFFGESTVLCLGIILLIMMCLTKKNAKKLVYVFLNYINISRGLIRKIDVKYEYKQV